MYQFNAILIDEMKITHILKIYIIVLKYSVISKIWFNVKDNS